MWRPAAVVLHSTLKFMLNQGACVEAYDYYTTLHALFDGSLHIGRVDITLGNGKGLCQLPAVVPGRGDLHERMLRPSSEARRIIEALSGLWGPCVAASGLVELQSLAVPGDADRVYSV